MVRLRRWVFSATGVLLALSAAAVAVEHTTDAGHGLVHRAATFGGFWLHVNDEQNVPTWFSTLLLAGIALAAIDVGRAERIARRSPTWAWFVMAAVFLALSFDEISQVHDRVAWLAAGLVVAAVSFAAAMVPLLVALPRGVAVRLLAAGGVFVLGAAGVDALEVLLGGTNQVLVHLEEAAEMFAAAFALVTIVDYRSALEGAEGESVRPR